MVIGGHDHRNARFVPVAERGRAPGLKRLRLSIELCEVALIHRAHPDVALLVEDEVERADRRAGLGDGHRVFDDASGLRIEHAENVCAEIPVPDHALRIDLRVVGQRFGARQIVFGDDHARGLAGGPGERFQRIPIVP